MTSKELWNKMEVLANQSYSGEQQAEFMELLKTAYNEDLELIISCVYIRANSQMAQQGYLEADGNRFLICYTNKNHAKREKRGGTWDIARARDILNNMFNKDAITGLVFNPEDEKMVIIFLTSEW